MANVDKIRNMLDNLINDKAEQAQIDFHEYLQGKMKEVSGIVNDEAPQQNED